MLTKANALWSQLSGCPSLKLEQPQCPAKCCCKPSDAQQLAKGSQTGTQPGQCRRTGTPQHCCSCAAGRWVFI